MVWYVNGIQIIFVQKKLYERGTISFKTGIKL